MSRRRPMRLGHRHVNPDEPRTGRRLRALLQSSLYDTDERNHYGTDQDPNAFVVGRILSKLRHAVLDTQLTDLAWELLHDFDGEEVGSCGPCPSCASWRRRSVKEIARLLREVQVRQGIVPKAQPTSYQLDLERFRFQEEPFAALHDLADAILADAQRHPLEATGGLAAWAHPHHGEARDTCGKMKALGHIHDGNVHAHGVEMDCGRYDCPTCKSRPSLTDPDFYELRGYEKRQGYAIHDRFDAAYEEHAISRRRQPVHHVTISPPQAWARALLLLGESGRKRLFKLAVKKAKSRRVPGGCIIYHHRRIPGRYNDRRCPSDGPHFHVLGWSELGDRYDGHACSQGYHRDGWVVKFIDAANAHKRSIVTTAAYVLSHANRPEILRLETELFPDVGRQRTADGYPGSGGAEPYPASPRGTSGEVERSKGGRNPTMVVRWFGSLSYNQLKVEKPEAPDHRECPVCHEKVPLDAWFRVRFGEAGIVPPPSGAVVDLEDVTLDQLPQRKRRRDPDHDGPDPDPLARPVPENDLSGSAWTGTWGHGFLHVHGAPACPCCEMQAGLEPEWRPTIIPGQPGIHRKLTGSGALQCAACGLIRAQVDDIQATDWPIETFGGAP